MGIGRVVYPDKNTSSNTNLLVGSSTRGGKDGKVRKGSSTKRKPMPSVAKKPIVSPTNPIIETEESGCSNHQPEKEEEEFNPILELVSTHIPS
jgi:hypothetical protein